MLMPATLEINTGPTSDNNFEDTPIFDDSGKTTDSDALDGKQGKKSKKRKGKKESKSTSKKSKKKSSKSESSRRSHRRRRSSSVDRSHSEIADRNRQPMTPSSDLLSAAEDDKYDDDYVDDTEREGRSTLADSYEFDYDYKHDKKRSAVHARFPSFDKNEAEQVEADDIDEDSFKEILENHRRGMGASSSAGGEDSNGSSHFTLSRRASKGLLQTDSATPDTEAESFSTSNREHPAVSQLRESQQKDGAAPTQFAKQQGERFQDYLKSTGQVDANMAAVTADAFEAFLQSTIRSGRLARSAVTEAAPSTTEMAGKEIDEDCIADDVSDLGNSLIGNDWDNGTFASYATKKEKEKKDRQQEKLEELERYHATAAKMRANTPGLNAPKTPPIAAGAKSHEDSADDEWGEIRRNEDFVRKRTEGMGNGPTRSPKPLQPQISVRSSVGSVDSACTSMDCSSTARVFERSFRQQWSTLSIEHKKCITALKKKWERSNPKFDDEWYLRFAKCSPGQPFTFKSAFRTMRKSNPDWLGHTMTKELERNLLTKMVVPCPDLRTIEGYDIFYMRPSLLFPKEMSTAVVSEQVAYVMNAMLEKEQACTDGIGLIFNMKGWTMKNFSLSSCNTICMHLQGLRYSPTRVSKFFIVDYPSWFGSIWSIMKPMLARSFRRKVHMVKNSQLPDYFGEGFERALPDDMFGGQASTEELIRNFITERKIVEAERKALRAALANEKRPGDQPR